MKKIKVRCWEIYCSKTQHKLFLTSQEEPHGTELITCMNCGHIYAIILELKLYSKFSLDQILEEKSCLTCNKILMNNYAYYPDTFVLNGKIYHFSTPITISLDNDKNSKFIEFNSIYNF